MKKTVKLQDIIEGMEMQFPETHTYLNLKTGEIITVSSDELRTAEEDEPIDHLRDWQQDAIKIAIDVIENFDHYKELPTQFEINEYDMMERFCFTLTEGHQNMLLNSIRGRGAFRRFKDKILDLGIDEEWYRYRDECYQRIAIEWCEHNGVPYIK